MELRFFAPGSLVSNLDFVEAVFGNGGDPFLPENDAALDVTGWTGHTGCVILAPHLTELRARDLGLPHVDQATARQKRDGMCWRQPEDRYNGGRAFKITARDAAGRMVTIIADNYFGYCKKEVKTQISFAANLYGLAEEEHSGGALAYPSYVLGQDFFAYRTFRMSDTTFEEAMQLLGDRAEVLPERRAVDRQYPDVHYVPEDCEFHVRSGVVSWEHQGVRRQLILREGHAYVLPTGYRVHLEKQSGGSAWRLIGTRPDGLLCHKPCTVSGGGKSEISKSLDPMIQRAPVFVKEHQRDMEAVAEIVKRDYSTVLRSQPPDARSRRPLLSPERSLGSVIKLLTPSPDYTDAHNAWARGLSQTIRQLVFVLKRYYQAEWGDDWQARFSVDRVNGYAGHELKFDGQRLVANYLRVGFEPDGATWRMYKLRPDFHPAEKVQVEDDITASVVLPRERVAGPGDDLPNPSVKLVQNCEALLFQRPDDAIHRGFDRQAEADIASPGTFLSNFEPLDRDRAQALVDRVVEFDLFSEPMKQLHHGFLAEPRAGFVVSSAHPRLVDGKPSKNPRYLQRRPDLVNARATHLAEVASRLHRRIPAGRPASTPVGAVLAGRRTNPPQPEIGAPPSGGVQPHPLPGASRALHGLGVQPHREVALHHRLRQRGRAHQGALQRRLAGGRPRQRPPLGHPHRLPRLHHRRRPRRPPLPGGARPQHAGAGGLVPHEGRPSATPPGSSPTATSRRWRTSSSTAGRCWPAGSAGASPPASPTTSWAGSSRPPAWSSPRRCSAPSCRAGTCSRPASTPSSRPRRGWREGSSRTGASRPPARRCGPCSTSWFTVSTRGWAPPIRASGPSLPASPRCAATGTGSACG